MPADNPELKTSRTVQRKEDLRKDLLNRDLQSIEQKAHSEKNILRSLSSLLYDKDSLVRWRAIEALGKASGIIAKTDPEKIRRQIRRILWLMNDESGGLCWNGPEAIGEILYNIPAWIDEYGPILISFINEEPFEGGVRNVIARIARKNPEVFANSGDIIAESLNDNNPAIRAFSIKALSALEYTSAFKVVEKLTGDMSSTEDYDFSTGELEEIAVSEFARAYLKLLH